jgi:protein gp37
MRLAGTRLKDHPSRAGLTREVNGNHVWTGEVRLNEQWIDQPLRWRKPRRIFVCAHGDLFHENVPDEWIDRVFAVMALTPQHTYQVLTKRPERMRDYFGHGGTCIPFGIRLEAKRLVGRDPGPLPIAMPNVWKGVSVEDQDTADARIPLLLETPAAVRFVSYEPALGPVDFTRIHLGTCDAAFPGNPEFTKVRFNRNALKGVNRPALDQVIAGGESGPGSRPMHPDWPRSIRDQCKTAGVPFFFKQWGDWFPCEIDIPSDASGIHVYPDEAHDPTADDWRFERRQVTRIGRQHVVRVGKAIAGRLLDGREHNGMPEGA